MCAFLHREKPDMSRHVNRLCDDETSTVIDDFDANAVLVLVGGYEDASRAGMLGDVGQGLGDDLDDDCLGRRRDLVGKLKIDLGLDPGVNANRFQVLPDGFTEV